QLADFAVTLSKIAPNQVVTSLNNLREGVTLAAGPNITITPSGNTLTIAGTDGSNTVYQATFSDQVIILDPQGRDVISKQVPAGRYLIFFKVGLANTDTSPQDASCSLSTGDKTTIRLDEGGGAANHGVLVLQDAATFSAPTTIKVHCSGFQIGYFPASDRLVLTAVKIGSIQ